MSGDGYSYPGYYHHSNTTSYPAASPTSWSNWNMQQQYMQNYARPSSTYNNSNTANHNNTHSQSNHTNNHNNSFRNQGYHSSPTHTNRSYHRNRYPNSNNNQYNGNGHQHGWQRNQNNYKRSRDSSESEPQIKTTKKKKKPLSQNIPNKREWSIEEAETALSTEKEYNKKSKNALIIKFPDQELNKDIVAQFHSSIENVHFQQPCTPRFCFVTLKETADPEKVISVLNKQKFGDGFLSVEYKKDREEDQAISAEDIDPLTLYVGNLAQEITKDDMLAMYPNNRRIDIGFAKKMKFTRYAFVGFRCVSDSLNAFKNTHNKQMYNKSLIVRFRRLHGTVGMPGESKPQNPPKSSDSVPATPNNVTDKESSEKVSDKKENASPVPKPPETPPEPNITTTTKGSCDNLSNFSDTTQVLDLEHIKKEQQSPNDSGDEINFKPVLPDYKSPFLSASSEEYVQKHKPKIKKETEIKTENEKKETSECKIKLEDTQQPVTVKDEPYDCNEDMVSWNDYGQDSDEADYEDDDNDNLSSDMTDFDRLYENMVNHANRITALKKTGI